MRVAGRALAAVLALVLGGAVGLAGVAVYAWWWGLAIAVAGTLAAELALRPGLQRFAFAVGWVAPAAVAMVPRTEGDFVIQSGVPGYTLLVLGGVVLLLASATLPLRRGNPERVHSRLDSAGPGGDE